MFIQDLVTEGRSQNRQEKWRLFGWSFYFVWLCLGLLRLRLVGMGWYRTWPMSLGRFRWWPRVGRDQHPTVSPRSRPAAGIRVGSEPTVQSNAGAPTGMARRPRPVVLSPRSRPATIIRVGSEPTVQSNAGATTGLASWTRPVVLSPRSRPAAGIRVGCEPTVQSNAGA